MMTKAIKVLALLACTAVMPAMAATYTVTKTADTFDGSCDSDCSLREAVAAANLRPGADTIVLSAGRYTFSIPPYMNDEGWRFGGVENGDLNVSDRLNLVGAGRDATVISAEYLDRVLFVDTGVTFAATKLTMTNGFGESVGGAVLNMGTTALRDVVISNSVVNASIDPAEGGGISNGGELVMENCIVRDNLALNGDFDKAVGGGIFNGGTLTLRRSTLSGNTAGSDVGDDFEDPITGSANSTGGGLFNAGTATIEQSAITYNSIPEFYATGSAIANIGQGKLTIRNSTISGNNGAGLGYALTNMGTLSLDFVTFIQNNSAGALDNTGSVSLNGTFMAGGCRNAGTYAEARSLLAFRSDTRCTASLYVDERETYYSMFEFLRIGGGVTETIKPRLGSLLVDAIDPSSAIDACPTVDQRGARRPPNDDGRRGLRCDIGAYELLQ